MLSRTISTLIALVLLVPAALFVVNCREVECHNSVNKLSDESENNLGSESNDTAHEGLAQSSTKTHWYAHEPWKNCTNCHDTQKQAEIPGRAYFISSMPTLCYNCHIDYTDSATFVHGPVAVGECLFCHFPHKSRTEYLLKEPVPELCYLCHEVDDIESISAHWIEEPSDCNGCHSAHSSSAKALLKKTSLQWN